MKVYRGFLIIVLIAVVMFGVWYCWSVYDKQQTIIDGTLVSGGDVYERDYSIY